MSGPKKPNAVFKIGDQAWVYLPSYGKGGASHVLVDVIDAKRAYVTVKAVDPGERLPSDKTDYHMETGQVRNRDRFGNYAPRLMTTVERMIEKAQHDARVYLSENGIKVSDLQGFWKEMGSIFLADQLQKAEINWRKLNDETGEQRS
jgi:hypothetical protein